MQQRRKSWLGPVQFVAQPFGEQRVIPVPVAPAIQGHQEQLDPLQLLQQRLRPARSGHRVTQRPGEALENRRPHQERADAG